MAASVGCIQQNKWLTVEQRWECSCAKEKLLSMQQWFPLLFYRWSLMNFFQSNEFPMNFKEFLLSWKLSARFYCSPSLKLIQSCLLWSESVSMSATITIQPKWNISRLQIITYYSLGQNQIKFRIRFTSWNSCVT